MHQHSEYYDGVRKPTHPPEEDLCVAPLTLHTQSDRKKHSKNANQFTSSDEKVLAYMINKTFQSVSTGRATLQPTHRQPASILPGKHHLSVEEIENVMAIYPRNAPGPDGIANYFSFQISLSV